MKDKLKGKAEELKGRLTGEPGEQAKGRARQEWGEAKDQARDARRGLEKSIRGDRRDEPPPAP